MWAEQQNIWQNLENQAEGRTVGTRDFYDLADHYPLYQRSREHKICRNSGDTHEACMGQQYFLRIHSMVNLGFLWDSWQREKECLWLFCFSWNLFSPTALPSSASMWGFVPSLIKWCYTLASSYHQEAWSFLKRKGGIDNVEEDRTRVLGEMQR